MHIKFNALNEIELLKPILAEASDKFILPRFRNLKEEEIIKSGRYDKIVTAADVEASRFILEFCRTRFEGSFTEEELSDDRFNYDVMWVIDPLDGTDEFKHDKESFCVQAALLGRRGELYFPVAGVIYLPLERKFLYATEDEGPFIDYNGKISRIELIRKKGIVATQRDLDRSTELDEFYMFARRKGLDIKVVYTGGAGHTVAQMLIGDPNKRPNLYLLPRPYSKEWDLSPSENMIARAGGWISDLHGSNFSYNRQNVRNDKGFIVSLGPEKLEITGLLSEFGVEKLLK